MVKQKIDKETKKAILDAKKLIEELIKLDANEADTRTRVRHIFGTIMGYDTFKHITAEYAIHTAGETVHCDLAIQLDREEATKPDFLIEIKRVGIDLSSKTIRQASSYAIDVGCEWVLLTNSKEWRLYHISFVKPPQTKLIASWNIISDTPTVLAEKFGLISYKNIKKGSLAKLWEKSNVLSKHNILEAILSEESIVSLKRRLKKSTDVTVTPEEIVGAVRQLLNEASVAEMERIKISLPKKKQTKKSTTT
jgi:hypothetical protein